MIDNLENNTLEEENNRAILVGLCTGNQKEFDSSMEELRNLTQACDMEVVEVLVQNLPSPLASTYIGSGKVEEICEDCEKLSASFCVFEDTLSPAQLKNLQKKIPVKIYDRTSLILEIFKRRAKTKEARLQVESAQLQYMMPRLIGLWEAIGRQGGGSGAMSNKGVGETQLELDRRLIQRRMTELRGELESIEHNRQIQRSRREKGRLPLVSLVGYTNAGKSTLMNRLLAYSGVTEDKEKTVLEKDMLFATLDTQVRRIESTSNKDFLLSDTVGFINKLPHQLVKAFRSTLDEACHADLLLEVVDYSDEHYREQMAVTAATLQELGADTIPRLQIMNKADRCMGYAFYPKRQDMVLYLSAREERCISYLIEVIESLVYADSKECTFLIPYSQGAALDDLSRNGLVKEREYLAEGTRIVCECMPDLRGRYERFIL